MPYFITIFPFLNDIETMVHLFLVTGCRRGEVLGLKWGKVDWENKQIYIDCNLLYRKELGIYEDTLKTKDSVRYIRLPHINPHAFRQMQASLLFFNGIESVSISHRLGHAHVSTITDIYSHVIKEAEERMSDCVADVILKPAKLKVVGD